MRRTWAARSTPRRSGCCPDLPPGAGSPGAGKDLVGPAAEQERVGALEDLVEKRCGLVIEERESPSAALESAPAVLVRPAKALHHAIDGDVRDGRQFQGFVL